MRTPLHITSLTLLGLAACGGGGGATSGDSSGGGGGGGGGGQGSLENSLTAFGVDVSQTPREADDASSLPADYAPLGKVWNMTRPAEVFLGRLPWKTSASPDLVWLEDLSSTSPGNATKIGSAEAPWAHDRDPDQHGYQAKRAFAAADVDGDGRDEVAAVRYDGVALILHVFGDADAQFAETVRVLENPVGVRTVSLAAADSDGDGRDELLVGWSTGGAASLTLVGVFRFAD